ncbi:hypothetical protein Agub_g13918, partial [Astrephomene gubernaculifera]
PSSVARYDPSLRCVVVRAHRDYTTGGPSAGAAAAEGRQQPQQGAERQQQPQQQQQQGCRWGLPAGGGCYPGEAVLCDSHGPHLSPAELMLEYGIAAEEEEEEEREGQEQQEGGVGSSSGGGWRRGRLRHRFDADAAEVVPPRSSRNAALLRALSAAMGPAAGAAGDDTTSGGSSSGSSSGLGISFLEGGPDGPSRALLRAARATDAELVRAGWRIRATESDTELACRVMATLGNTNTTTTSSASLSSSSSSSSTAARSGNSKDRNNTRSSSLSPAAGGNRSTAATAAATAGPVGVATEAAALRAAADYLRRALEAFPTPLEEDLARLAAVGGVEGAERLALVAVASQKRALLGSQAAVAGWLERLDGGCPVAELYEDEEEDEYEDEDEEYGDEEGGYEEEDV